MKRKESSLCSQFTGNKFLSRHRFSQNISALSNAPEMTNHRSASEALFKEKNREHPNSSDAANHNSFDLFSEEYTLSALAEF